MAIISQETFDKFTEEEKSEFRKIYNEILTDYQNAKKQGYVEKSDEIFDRLVQLEIFFGKENLQPENKIKTWEDVEKIKDSYKSMVDYLLKFSNDIKLNKKLAATFQIKLLIELGYGGMVTEEEWKNDTIRKESIVPCDVRDGFKFVTCYYLSNKNFIAFHNIEQAEEFMSYPENRKLVEQYYMI